METENKIHPIDERLARFSERVAALDPLRVSISIIDSPMHMKYFITLYGRNDEVVIEIPYEFFAGQPEHPLNTLISQGPDQAEAYIRTYYALSAQTLEAEMDGPAKAAYFKEKLAFMLITPQHELIGCIAQDGIHIAAFLPKGENPEAQKLHIPGKMICTLLGRKASKRITNLRHILYAYKVSKENQNAKNS